MQTTKSNLGKHKKAPCELNVKDFSDKTKFCKKIKPYVGNKGLNSYNFHRNEPTPYYREKRVSHCIDYLFHPYSRKPLYKEK